MSLPKITLGTVAIAVLFIANVALANWSLVHIGIDNGQAGPRTLPLGFGVFVPSGVVFAGVLLTLRDVLHERIGALGILGVILLSAPVSAFTSTPALALASGVTFALAELADLVIYQRIRKHGRWKAVIASNIFSSTFDSLIFLAMAFGMSVAIQSFLPMTLGKFLASFLTFGIVLLVSRSIRPARSSVTPNASNRSPVELS